MDGWTLAGIVAAMHALPLALAAILCRREAKAWEQLRRERGRKGLSD